MQNTTPASTISNSVDTQFEIIQIETVEVPSHTPISEITTTTVPPSSTPVPEINTTTTLQPSRPRKRKRRAETAFEYTKAAATAFQEKAKKELEMKAAYYEKKNSNHGTGCKSQGGYGKSQ